MEFTAILIILLLGIGCGVFFGRKIEFRKNNDKFTVNSTVKEILPVSEYAGLVYHYSSVVSHSQVNKLFKLNLPLTEKKSIYTIDGVIKLGIDGREIKINVASNKIKISVPAIKILSHEIFPETFKIYDEKTSIFNRYSLKEYNEIGKQHKQNKENDVLQDKGLLIQAGELIEQQFGSILKNIPWIKDVFTVVFEWEEEDSIDSRKNVA
jgi:hypothetical protein